jgi:hypothetical protein
MRTLLATLLIAIATPCIGQLDLAPEPTPKPIEKIKEEPITGVVIDRDLFASFFLTQLSFSEAARTHGDKTSTIQASFPSDTTIVIDQTVTMEGSTMKLFYKLESGENQSIAFKIVSPFDIPDEEFEGIYKAMVVNQLKDAIAEKQGNVEVMAKLNYPLSLTEYKVSYMKATGMPTKGATVPEVKEVFGAPHDTKSFLGATIWQYRFPHPSGINDLVSVTFDQSGIVTNFSKI